MIPMVHVLSTAYGDFEVPEAMAILYQSCKIRRDGQPDRRTRYGKLWSEKFVEFQNEKEREYLAA